MALLYPLLRVSTTLSSSALFLTDRDIRLPPATRQPSQLGGHLYLIVGVGRQLVHALPP
jgi:hypothetical protein